MGKIIANVLSKLGVKAAATGSKACYLFWLDEPECPKSLIK